VAQQAKADAFRVEAEAARPGEGRVYAAPHLALHFIPHLPLSALEAPLGGAAATEGQAAISALDMDFSSCGSDRARSQPDKVIIGTKKAAYNLKTRRLASNFFLPAASSYHEVLTVAQLDKACVVCAEAGAIRPDEGLCHAAPCPPPPPPSATSPT
jgi:hypothetical protein